MKTHICCGSKKYKSLNFDKLVDSFDEIVRHNFLTSNQGYGLKDSTIQVLNNHAIEVAAYALDPIESKKPSFFSESYDISSYEEEYGMGDGYILEFIDSLDLKNTSIINYSRNNTEILQKVLLKYSVRHPFFLKNGLSYAALLLHQNIKPFLIGYSIAPSELERHVYNSRAIEKINKCHKDDLECELIIKMHELNLVDASFCAIEDEKEIRFNNLLKPTEESIKILENFYDYSG